MNDKGILGSRNYHKANLNHIPKPDFEELLEIVNLFSDSLRKPYKTAVLTSRSIAEFINPSASYTKFNSDFFKLNRNQMTAHDFNNILLIRALVERNYHLLLRLFNEAPLFMSRKLDLPSNSRCYFLLKVVLLFANLANPYKQIDEGILSYLEKQLSDEMCLNVLDIKKEFFGCMCIAETGNFVKYIEFLAKKDKK